MNAELMEVALKTFGLKEAPGTTDSPIILQWAKEAGFEHDYGHDSDPWCSLAVNYWALKAGYERSHKLNARSWLSVGEKIIEPEIGDVVIIWRESPVSWKGHVGIYVNSDQSNINILAGNQGDQVSIASFPKARLLGYRRLNKTK